MALPFRTRPRFRLAHIELGQSLVDAKGAAGSGRTAHRLGFGPHLIRIVQQIGIRCDLDAHIVVHLRLGTHTADVDADTAAASSVLQMGVGVHGEGGG